MRRPCRLPLLPQKPRFKMLPVFRLHRLVFLVLLMSIPPSGVLSASPIPAEPAAELRAPAALAPWVSDQGDGSYRNPVLYADYSDPDAVRVGEDFWMTASSFNHVPGLPILHSRALVNWTLVNHALPVQVLKNLEPVLRPLVSGLPAAEPSCIAGKPNRS